MALITDIMNQNAFSAVEFHEEVVESVEYKPQLFGGLDLFDPIYSRSPTIVIASKDGKLSLIPTSADGSPPEELIPEGAKLRPFHVSRLAKGSTVYASEMAGVLNLPSEEQFKEIVEELTERSAQISDDMEYTWEHMRLGAVLGEVYDADGSTVIYDWFEQWGIAKPDEINFALNTANTDVRKKCRDLSRAMQKAAKGVWRPGVRIIALTGDAFFDKLVNHNQIKETKLGTEKASKLENIEGFSAIDIENITFINYRGSDDGKLAIATDEAKFFPKGAKGAFQVGWGPMNESKQWLNKKGQPKFTLLLEDTSGREAWDRVEMYSYPLFICTRPAMLRTATMA